MTAPRPSGCQRPCPDPAQQTGQVTVTGLIVVVPFAGPITAIWLLWGRGVGLADLGLAVLLYPVTRFGVTVGFHRCLTHPSFTARPALRVAQRWLMTSSVAGITHRWSKTFQVMGTAKTDRTR
jgi:stearoyl-CoA desaturase (Delta-9 desaturase)